MSSSTKPRSVEDFFAGLMRRNNFGKATGASFLGGMAAYLVLFPALSPAQEALRYSLAGDTAAAANRINPETLPYTFKEGDFRLLIAPSLELDYNDNVNLSKDGAQGAFILKPLVQFTGSYPISQQNLLRFSVGVGYDEYLEQSYLSAFRLNSDSAIAFDIYVKDVTIDLHDRFSYTEDPSGEAAVAGSGEYGTFMNGAGLSATWDLEDVVLTLGYDHQNVLATSSQFNQLNRSSELPVARAGFKFTPQLTAGLEGSASFTTYDQQVLNNNNTYSIGVYADWQPGAYFHVQPRVGYTIEQFQQSSISGIGLATNSLGEVFPVITGIALQTRNLNAWYADLTVSHQFSEVASYSFSAGHELRPGIESDAVEDWYFRPTLQLHIIKDLAINPFFTFEHGTQGEGNVTGNLTETYDYYGVGFSASYPIAKKLSLGLNYRCTLRSSTLGSQQYSQNIVGLQLTYHP